METDIQRKGKIKNRKKREPLSPGGFEGGAK